MAGGENGVHILVFPYPAQGHMLPLLDLSHQLSLRGLSITILITPKNLPILTPLLSANPSIQTLIFPFPNYPSIPPGVENIKDLGNKGNIPMMLALTKLQDPIIQWYNSHSNPPVALLSDFFLGWTHHLANHLSIPRIVFYCSGAFAVNVFDHLWTNPEAVKPGCEVKFQDLPGSPSFTWDQLPSLFRHYMESNPTTDLDSIKTSMAANCLSWASVFNTFDALEHEFLDYLNNKTGHPRVYSVGPIDMVVGSDKLRAGHDNAHADNALMSWLDKCEDGSVLYVCFGSQKILNKAQTEALANGLETSGVLYVWIVNDHGSVPDPVSKRGFVVNGWAPQRAILGHRAVGGFLSHCGWNSVLEAVGSGAVILGWPMEAEQFVNARLLVERKGAAVLMAEGGDSVPDSAELARKIAESMRGDAVERVRAKELRDEAWEAVKVGGSSDRDLDRLVQELAQLKSQ
ncbi:hypothetical protein ACP275_05G025800 [Erythranthe tilingii]